MDAAFLKAAQLDPGAFRSLGLPLHPLTLGHLFLLHEYGSAFVQPSASAAGEDLILSVFICAQPHASARRNIRRTSTLFFLRLWGWSCRRYNLLLETGRFNAYLAHHLTAPAARSAFPNASSRELRAPNHWRLLTMLMVDFQMTERDALNTPMLKAHCLWATEAERNGSVELLQGGRLDSFWNECHRLDLEKFGADGAGASSN